jgi:hypothetical protein
MDGTTTRGSCVIIVRRRHALDVAGALERGICGRDQAAARQPPNRWPRAIAAAVC